MPVSKKRKKGGKKVKFNPHKDGGTKLSIHDRESHLTLQDLINVVAFREYKEAGILGADNRPVDDNIQTFDDRVREDMYAAGVDPDGVGAFEHNARRLLESGLGSDEVLASNVKHNLKPGTEVEIKVDDEVVGTGTVLDDGNLSLGPIPAEYSVMEETRLSINPKENTE